MMAKKPLQPDERVLQYAEFAVEFDVASNLDMYGRYLNFCQFYSLDVFLPLMGVVAVICLLAIFATYRTILWLCRCRPKPAHVKLE